MLYVASRSRSCALLTRTSLSPTLGTGALSLSLRASKPLLPSIVHCLVVEGAMVCDVIYGD